MAGPIPNDVVQRFDHIIRTSGDWDSDWLEQVLDDYPMLVQRRLTDGRLPLRALLDQQSPWLFEMLEQHGAKHDLLTAAAACDLKAVRRLLAEEPTQVHDEDAGGNTPLHWACTAGLGQSGGELRPQVVSLLLEADADSEAINEFEETPLDCAVLHGGGNAVESLLEHDVVLTTRFAVADEDFELLDSKLDIEPDAIGWRSRRDGSTLLHLAVYQECGAEMIHYLLAHGADKLLNAQTKCGMTPLLQATLEKAYDEAEALVRAGADANLLRPNGRYSPLDEAVQQDRVQLAELLLDRGARVRRFRHENLLCYVTSGEMADLLIERGFDPQLATDDARTPLDFAVEEGRRNVVAALLRSGVDPTFYAYVVLGNVEKVAEMIDERPELVRESNGYGLPPEPVSGEAVEVLWGSYGGTALHYAVKSGSLRMVRYLLERGADVNAATQAGWTPLHDAVYYSIYNDLRDGRAIVQTLFAAGADRELRTTGGTAPLGMAYFLETLGGCSEDVRGFIEFFEGL